MATSSDAQSKIAGLTWWHTIEVAPGVLTPGRWDLRHTADRLPWPSSTTGLRCLDIGTMDGFWAFELERRGAAEVVAIDVVDPRRTDTPLVKRRPGPSPPDQQRGWTFQAAANLLGSRVQYRDLSVYDLRPEDVGRFDLIVMGYVLQALRDPLRALEAVRGVCRGHFVLLDTVSLPLSLLPSSLARLDARRDGREWFVFNRRGLRKALELAGFVVEAMTPILRDPVRQSPGSPKPVAARNRLMYGLGLRGRAIAARARPL